MAGKRADLISESVPEDPALKRQVFSQFNAICPGWTIFTTNSSTLLPSMIADATGRPDRFAALHFHDCSVTNVVDVMPHPGTSARTLERVLTFCRDIDQFPIELKKEQHGYVLNTMLSELLGTALSLASRDVASPDDIDRAWMGIMKTAVGPFGIMDSIGLETVYRITDYWAEDTRTKQKEAMPPIWKSLWKKEIWGSKPAQGFITTRNQLSSSPISRKVFGRRHFVRDARCPLYLNSPSTPPNGSF